MMVQGRVVWLAGLAACLLTGCEDVKDQLGLSRRTPDEFAVMERAPLEVPQDLSQLPQPNPGALRPQETPATQMAKSAVLGMGKLRRSRLRLPRMHFCKKPEPSRVLLLFARWLTVKPKKRLKIIARRLKNSLISAVSIRPPLLLTLKQKPNAFRMPRKKARRLQEKELRLLKNRIMLRLLRSSVCAALLLCGGAQAHALDKVYNAQSAFLDNGMQVVVIPNTRAPVVSHMVWYKVGAADEPQGDGVSGAAHFLEHLMFKGSKALEPGEFSKTIKRYGGNDNAFTSWDYTAFFSRSAPNICPR